MKNFDLKKTIIVFLLVLAIALGIMIPVRVSIAKKMQQPIFRGDTEDEQKTSKLATLVSGENCIYADAFKDNQRINVLILGVATTVIGKDLTDTIMLCSYDRKDYSFDLISVPRDTYHYRDKYSIWSGNQKINSVYETEGILGIANAVSEELSGIPIHYYVTVSYNDIKKLIDVIGGVDVDVPFHLRYEDPTDNPPLNIDIPKGRQHITSENVIQLLRFRKTNPWFAEQGYKSYSDTGRMEMQQQFITACIKKLISKPSYVKKVLDTAIDSIGSNITYEEALDLSSDITKLDLSNVHTYTVPTDTKGTSETGGISYLFVKTDELKTILDGIFIDAEASEQAQ